MFNSYNRLGGSVWDTGPMGGASEERIANGTQWLLPDITLILHYQTTPACSCWSLQSSVLSPSSASLSIQTACVRQTANQLRNVRSSAAALPTSALHSKARFFKFWTDLHLPHHNSNVLQPSAFKCLTAIKIDLSLTRTDKRWHKSSMGDTNGTDPQVSQSGTADGTLSSSNIPNPLRKKLKGYNNTESHGKKKKRGWKKCMIRSSEAQSV